MKVKRKTLRAKEHMRSEKLMYIGWAYLTKYSWVCVAGGKFDLARVVYVDAVSFEYGNVAKSDRK